jgi:hypothetical protein
VVDAQSKVTLRPRSKLERLLEPLSNAYTIPERPDVDVLSQLTLLYLVGSGGDRKAALAAMSPLCAKNGRVDPEKLARTTREIVAAVCPEPYVDDAHQALRAAGEAASGAPDLDARCRGDLSDARRLLRSLPLITEQRADLLLLYSGAHAVVAPSPQGIHVAARLGYPGAAYASFARALDAELPDLDGVEVAWRAHHLLDQHGKGICAQKAPQCARCPIRDACAFKGEGEDPADRLYGAPRPE